MSEAVSRANVATATVYKVNRIYLFTGIVVRSVGGNFLSTFPAALRLLLIYLKVAMLSTNQVEADSDILSESLGFMYITNLSSLFSCLQLLNNKSEYIS